MRRAHVMLASMVCAGLLIVDATIVLHTAADIPAATGIPVDPGPQDAPFQIPPERLAAIPAFQPYDARLLPSLSWLTAGSGFDQALFTTHFTHTYRRAEVGVIGNSWVLDSVWPGKGIPKFIEAIVQFLETAYTAYGPMIRRLPAEGTERGTSGIGAPVGVPVRVHYLQRDGPAAFDHLFNRIEIDTSSSAPKNEPDRFRHRSAHELFHLLQSRRLGGGRQAARKMVEPGTVSAVTGELPGYWWIEASAEVAATRVAWTLPHAMAKSVDDIYPYLLEYPMTAHGVPRNLHDMRAATFEQWKSAQLEYQRAYFISYLMDHGADFFDMNERVLGRYAVEEHPVVIFNALNEYLAASPARKRLPVLFREFAAWFLVGDESPLAKQTPYLRPSASVVKTTTGEERAADIIDGRDRRAVQHTLSLDARFTAQLWAVTIDATKAAVPTRRIRVSAVDLAPAEFTTVQVFSTPEWKRLPGDPVPTGVLRVTNDVVNVDLTGITSLYILVTNTSDTSSGRATIRVDDVTPDPAPPPPPSPARPTAAPSRGAATTAASGYWKFVHSTPTQYAPPAGDTAIVSKSFTVSEGSITGRMVSDSHNGEGPATWAGSCTWTWAGRGSLDTLVPGDQIEVAMSVTDQSVPEKVSGWNHGRTGVSGAVRFDKAGMEWGTTHAAATEASSAAAGWKQALPATGTLTVPAGPGHPDWAGRAALVASCSFGRFERVYEWMAGKAPAASATTPPSGGARPVAAPSVTGTWIGTWSNAVGESGRDSLDLTEEPDGRLTGTWTGSIPVTGRRLGANELQLTGRTSTRAYTVAVTVSGDSMTLKYVSTRLNAAGRYEGTSTLTRAR